MNEWPTSIDLPAVEVWWLYAAVYGGLVVAALVVMWLRAKWRGRRRGE